MIKRFIDKHFATFFFSTFFIVNSWFWIAEEYLEVEHKTYWYDVVQINVWLIGALIALMYKECKDG